MIRSETPATRSVLARLLNESKRTGETYNTLLSRYVGFRLLYRLTQSRHAEAFLLKGAIMFLFWLGEMHRPTKDLDLLGTTADAGVLKQVFIEIAAPTHPRSPRYDLSVCRLLPARRSQRQTRSGV